MDPHARTKMSGESFGRPLGRVPLGSCHGSFAIQASVLPLYVGLKPSGWVGKLSESVSPVTCPLPAMPSGTKWARSRSMPLINASSPGHIRPQLAW